MDSEQLDRAMEGMIGATSQMLSVRRREYRRSFINIGYMPRTPSRSTSPPRFLDGIGLRTPPTTPPPLRDTLRMPLPLNLNMTDEEWNFLDEYASQATDDELNGVNEDYMRHIEQLNPPTRQVTPNYVPNHKKSAIGKVRFNTTFQCAICLEDHTNGESVTTECGHSYGKQCWETWMRNQNSNKCCPTCRKSTPKTTCYTLRADRKPKPQEKV